MRSSFVAGSCEAHVRPGDERAPRLRGPFECGLGSRGPPQHAPINEKAAQTVAPAALPSGTTGLGP